MGTTTELRNRRPVLDHGGLLAWRRDGLDVVMRGQSLAATNHAGLIIGRANVSRVDVTTPEGLHHLDDVTPSDLIGRAHAESRSRSPELAPFFAHNPQPYRPLHSKELSHAQS